MIRLEDRQVIAQAVGQAHKAGARLKPACELTGITVRTPAFVNEVARFSHAAFFSAEHSGCSSRGGFSHTSVTGVQFRVSPDQRSGCACLAAS